MPSADFCTAVSAPCRALSPESETRCSPPAIRSTAVHTQPPDLRSAPLMEMRFAVFCPLARRSRLLSGSCPSARAFAPRFLQTPPRDDALAVRYPSPPSGWERTCTSKLSSMRGVQKRAGRDARPALTIATSVGYFFFGFTLMLTEPVAFGLSTVELSPVVHKPSLNVNVKPSGPAYPETGVYVNSPVHIPFES
jgi:hypothetical protein